MNVSENNDSPDQAVIKKTFVECFFTRVDGRSISNETYMPLNDLASFHDTSMKAFQ